MSSTAASGSTSSAAVKTTSGSLGTFLADGKGRTLYLWLADKSDQSTCYNACAQFWPPLLTKGSPTAGSGVDASKLGISKRTDGTTQVTYNGHPLYYFAEDTAAGDANGEGNNGFGALWWVVGPNGAAVTGSSGAASSSGGGYNY
jgi:predicted lipoprotein with Yx(FWY)xxD motif